MSKINPKALKNIFTEDILNALPKNEQIARGVAAIKKFEDPEYVKKHKEAIRKAVQTPEHKDKQSKIAKEKAKDPEYIKKLKLGVQKSLQNPENKKRHLDAINQITKDPEYKKKQLEGIRRVTQTKEWREAQLLGMQKVKEKPDYIELRKLVGEKNKTNLKWKENCKKGKQQFLKPVQTPDGVFASRKDAAVFYNIDPTQVTNKIKLGKYDWYYITQEEYILLTGQEPK